MEGIYNGLAAAYRCQYCSSGRVECAADAVEITTATGRPMLRGTHQGRCQACGQEHSIDVDVWLGEVLFDTAAEQYQGESISFPMIREEERCPACDAYELEVEVELWGIRRPGGWPMADLHCSFRCRECGFEDAFVELGHFDEAYAGALAKAAQRYSATVKKSHQ